MIAVGRIAQLSLVLASLVAAGSGQQKPERRLVSMGMPSYPPLARQARIAGEVRVDIEIDREGNVLSASSEEQTGEPKSIGLLRPEAVKNARSWKFAQSGSSEQEHTKATAIFQFKLEGEARVTFYPSLRVEIVPEVAIIDTDNATRGHLK